MIRNNGPAYKDSNVVIQTNMQIVSNNKARKSNQEQFPNQNILLRHFHSITSFPTSTHPKGSHSNLVPAIQLRMCSTLVAVVKLTPKSLWWFDPFLLGRTIFQYFQGQNLSFRKGMFFQSAKRHRCIVMADGAWFPKSSSSDCNSSSASLSRRRKVTQKGGC